MNGANENNKILLQARFNLDKFFSKTYEVIENLSKDDGNCHVTGTHKKIASVSKTNRSDMHYTFCFISLLPRQIYLAGFIKTRLVTSAHGSAVSCQ